MQTMTNQNPAPFALGTLNTSNMHTTFDDEENRMLKKIKQSPILPLATVGFLGIAGYRIYNARNRGNMKLSFFLIHTRLAAQGLATAVLGSLVLYSLGERMYNSVMKKNEPES